MPRQGIGALIALMAGMALDPVPFDIVASQLFVQHRPQIGVLDRLFRRRAPAIALPFMDPLGDALPDILRVGVKIDAATVGKIRFDVESARRQGDNLEIAVRTPDADFIDLFAEGPQDWFLGQPQLIAREGAIARYRLPLDGMPEGETVSGRTFTFVAVADGKAIEKPVLIE